MGYIKMHRGSACCALSMKTFLILFTIGLAASIPVQNQTTPGNVESISDALFYAAPAGFESTAPGTILRYRRAPRPITLDSITPILPKNAWQILYRTQNSVGEPKATVVTVLEPFNPKRNNLFVESFFTVILHSGINLLGDTLTGWTGFFLQRVP
jgi:hypothetical protein